MKLTDAAIRKARPGLKPYRLSDGRGLLLSVRPTGAKWWRFRYRFARQEKMLSFGIYPDVSLALARDRLLEARRWLAQGIDPSAKRKEQRDAQRNSFEAVALDWLACFARHVEGKKRAAKTYKQAKALFDTHLFPDLRSRPIGEITAPELLRTLKLIESRGLYETTRRAKQRCGQVFRHAIGLGYAQRDLTVELRGLLEAPIVQHHASITDPAAIADLLQKLDNFSGRPVTAGALQLAPLVFVRPSELRAAQWSHIYFERAEWRIPISLMKMDEQHIVPLSRQAMRVLTTLREITGKGRYVFPAQGKRGRMMSENTVNKALRSLGYSGEDLTGHGFRSMASTLLNEHGWPPDAIERQLSHAQRDETRAAYNYAEYLPERVLMMQAWADYLDDLRARRFNTSSLDHRKPKAHSSPASSTHHLATDEGPKQP